MVKTRPPSPSAIRRYDSKKHLWDLHKSLQVSRILLTHVKYEVRTHGLYFLIVPFCDAINYLICGFFNIWGLLIWFLQKRCGKFLRSQSRGKDSGETSYPFQKNEGEKTAGSHVQSHVNHQLASEAVIPMM